MKQHRVSCFARRCSEKFSSVAKARRHFGERHKPSQFKEVPRASEVEWNSFCKDISMRINEGLKAHSTRSSHFNITVPEGVALKFLSKFEEDDEKKGSVAVRLFPSTA